MDKSVVLEEDRVKKITDKAERLANGYIPNDEDNELIQRVYERFQAMRDSDERKAQEADWDDADKQYQVYQEAQAEDDQRTNIKKPIAFSVIETEMQETIDRNSRPYVNERKARDIVQAKLTNDILKFSYDVGDFDLNHYNAKQEALTYGTGYMMEYYRQDKRIINDLKLTKNPDTGEYEESYEPREIIDFEDEYAENVHVRYIYVDPSAAHISKARDMVRREILDIDEFRRKYSLRRGFTNIEYVEAGGDTYVEGFYARPQDITDKEVEVLHYYNRAIDRYDVVANGRLVRKGAIPMPAKELPLVVYYCYKPTNSFFGMGIPKIVKSLSEERETSANLRMDTIKQGLHKMFFYDDLLEIDELDLVARPHGGIPINTQGRPIDQLIRWIEYGDVKPSTYREEEITIEDIRRTTGVDDRLQGVSQGGTATESAILKESSMKRILAQMKRIEMDALIRLGRMRLKNIAFFYPIPKIETILTDEKEENKSKTSYKTISVEGKSYQLDEGGNLSLDFIDGVSSLKLDKKMSKFLDGEQDFTFIIKESTPVSKALMQSKITEMIKTIYSNPILSAAADPKKVLKRYAQIMEEEPDDWSVGKIMDDTDMQLLAESENKIMSAGIPLPPTPGATEAHSTIHLHWTQTSEYERLKAEQPAVAEAVDAHLSGEVAKLSGQGMPGGSGAGVPGTTNPAAPMMNPNDLAPNMRGAL